MNNDEEFMREALKEAGIAREKKDWAIGCVITLDNKIIARGRNRVFSTKDRLLHAEVDAIKQFQSEHFYASGKEFTLYVTLEPCPMCFGAILMAGIHRIVAGTNFDSSGASAYFNHLPDFFQQPRFQTTMVSGVLNYECAMMWRSGVPAQTLYERDGILDYPISKNQLIKTYVTSTKSGALKQTPSHKVVRKSAKSYIRALKTALTTSS